MAVTSTEQKAMNTGKISTGSWLDDASSPDAASITLGRDPVYIRVENETDRIAFEWFKGQATANGIKTVAAGTRTLLTSAGITVVNDTIGFPVIQSKQYRYYALS